MTTIRTVIGAFVLGLVTHVATAQQPNASAAAFGMAGNYTAAASGSDAVAWNPAMLGMNSPSFSISVLSLGVVTGLDPVKLKDITDFGGKVIPNATKEAWLNKVGAGTEQGVVDGGLSIVALSIGRIGFQVGLSGTAQVNLNQDAAEAILYGNAGRAGTAKNLALNGSNAGGSSFVTGAASIAIPLPFTPTGRPGEQFSLGVTGKYIGGLGVARAQDNGSLVTQDNIGVSFPAIYTDSNHVGSAGSGVGVDLGLAWTDGATTFGVTARNLVNTFAWSTSALASTPGTVTFNGTDPSKTNFDAAPYASAPASMRAALEAEKFKPELAVGVARRMDKVTLTADGSTRIGDGIEIGPRMHVGVGAELRFIPLLPLRAGVAAITDGFQVAGGAGLHLGPFELGVAGSVRSKSKGTDYGAMVSLLSIR
jgi:hypothetical protein